MDYAPGPELAIIPGMGAWIILRFNLYVIFLADQRPFFTAMSVRVHCDEYMYETSKVNDGATQILRKKLTDNQLKIFLYCLFAPDQFAVSRYEILYIKLRQLCYAAGEKLHVPAGKVRPSHAHIEECIT